MAFEIFDCWVSGRPPPGRWWLLVKPLTTAKSMAMTGKAEIDSMVVKVEESPSKEMVTCLGSSMRPQERGHAWGASIRSHDGASHRRPTDEASFHSL